MQLGHARSKAQVEEALDGGDEELREDIERRLGQVREWWRTYGSAPEDSETFHFSEFIAKDAKFLDAVIEQSPARYNLSNVPRGLLDAHMRRAARRRAGRPRGPFGPFQIGKGVAELSLYEIRLPAVYFMPEGALPTNAEFIPKVIAQGFWDSLGAGGSHKIEWEQRDIVHEQSGSGASVTSEYVEAEEHQFEEWCLDILSDYMRDTLRRDETEALKLFFLGLAAEDRDLAARLKAVNLSDDELLSFAAEWFARGGRDEVLETIRAYFDTIDTPPPENQEVVAQVSESDLRAIGITQGTLWEERPWSLVKLTPQELSLEGMLMNHCVGIGNMGYVKAVKDKEIEIWSFRSRSNKPRFTLEVDSEFYSDSMDPGSPEQVDRWLREKRGRTIKQLKGKGNRTPGFADMKASAIKFPDELVLWKWLLDRLGVDPDQVKDFDSSGLVRPNKRTSRRRTSKRASKRMSRNRAACAGFDMPYRRFMEQRESK